MGYVKESLERQIDNLSDQISRLEDEYESLRRFKELVYSAQDDFNTANDKRRIVLKDIDSVKKNNKSAQKYQAGMGNSLTGIGSKVAGASFWGLLASIDLKMTQYLTQIGTLSLAKGELELEYRAIDTII